MKYLLYDRYTISVHVYEASFRRPYRQYNYVDKTNKDLEVFSFTTQDTNPKTGRHLLYEMNWEEKQYIITLKHFLMA